MQAAPAYEGMFLHGILHRIEGDYDNARIWYRDVADSEVFKHTWDTVDEALGFIGDVQSLKNGGAGSGGSGSGNKKKGGGEGEGKNKEELEAKSRREFEKVIEWCEKRFGTDTWEDGTKAWVKNSEKISEISQDMVTGDSGHRKF